MTLGTALQGSARVLTDPKEELGGDGAVSQGQGRLRGVLEGGRLQMHTQSRGFRRTEGCWLEMLMYFGLVTAANS